MTKNNKKEYRCIAELRHSEASEKMVIEGKAIAFNSETVIWTDERGNDYKEVIVPEALNDTDLSDIVLRYNHLDSVPILSRTRGGHLTTEKKSDGLYFRAELFDTQQAKDCFELVKAGALQCSFAFTVKPNGDSFDESTLTRRISAIDRVFDIALVDFPAYQETFVAEARSIYQPFAVKREDYETRKELHDILERENRTVTIYDYKMPAILGEVRKALADHKAGKLNGLELWNRCHYELELNARMETIPFDVDRGGDPVELLEEAKIISELRQLAYTEYTNEMKRLNNGQDVKDIIFKSNIGTTNRNEVNNNMENTKLDFYKQFVEGRAAGNTTTIAAMIPTEILDDYKVEETPFAFYEGASKTAIKNAGTLKLPIASLVDVAAHTENAEITPNAIVPSTVSITHSEYVYNVGYSKLGMVTSAESFETIVKDVLYRSMMKKLDGLCYAAVSGLSYTTGTNAVEYTNGSKPTFANFCTVASYLGTDFYDGAKWYMSHKTYLSLVASLVDDNDKPVFDPTKKISDQALLGFGIEVDSQIAAGTIYFGKASAVHLNNAQEPTLNTWTNFDTNTEMAGVSGVSGAGIETGSFVKLSEAAA